MIVTVIIPIMIVIMKIKVINISNNDSNSCYKVGSGVLNNE